MVESRSMVSGPSPGPARCPGACQQLPRSSWRTWPQRKLRRKVPRVDGALTVPPRVQAVPPVRNTSASSMQSPPASAEATSVPVFARPHRPGRGAAGRVRAGRDAGPGWREGAARHWPPGGGRRRYGCGRTSIGCSLFWGRFENHYPRFKGAPSCFFRASHMPSLGGFGLKQSLE